MKTTMNKNVAIVGYSGHAYVIIDILLQQGRKVTAYCDQEEKQINPYNLFYLGREEDAADKLKEFDYFVCIGNNDIRQKIHNQFCRFLGNPVNAIHPKAVIAPSVKLDYGIMIAANSTINPFTEIGTGVICNTSSGIDHECIIGDFSHIAPGAVLCGNVTVGKNTFVGANAVVRQGIKIGNNVTIGAGAVVIKDVPDYAKVIGNPARRVT